MPARLLARMTRRPASPSNLDGEDQVVLFPSLGHLSRDGRQWIVGVHGDVFAPGQLGLTKRVLLKLLQRAMRVPDEAMRSEIFQQRIARFVAFDRPGLRMAVRIADQVHPLAKPTKRNGHFVDHVRVPRESVSTNGVSDNTQAIAEIGLEVCRGHGHPPLAAGQAWLLPTQGLSIISDIDDTLKHSYVACKRTLLANTFLRPFETIPGMAAVFQDWSQRGAAFHYVSSSPWQLYPHLAEHLAAHDFPTGSFHLRAFRLRDHLLRRMLMLRRSGKASVIRAMFKTFPQRQFLMVGDSGEADPEIYGTMARRFPEQIAGILIRRLAGRHDTAERYARAFRGVQRGLVRLYHESEELAEVELPKIV